MSRAHPWPEGVTAVEHRGPCWIVLFPDGTSCYVAEPEHVAELVGKALTHEQVARAHRAVAAALTCRQAPTPLGEQVRYTAEDVARAAQDPPEPPPAAEPEPVAPLPYPEAKARPAGVKRAKLPPKHSRAQDPEHPRRPGPVSPPIAFVPTAEVMALVCEDCGHPWRLHGERGCTRSMSGFTECGCTAEHDTAEPAHATR